MPRKSPRRSSNKRSRKSLRRRSTSPSKAKRYRSTHKSPELSTIIQIVEQTLTKFWRFPKPLLDLLIESSSRIASVDEELLTVDEKLLTAILDKLKTNSYSGPINPNDIKKDLTLLTDALSLCLARVETTPSPLSPPPLAEALTLPPPPLHPAPSPAPPSPLEEDRAKYRGALALPLLSFVSASTPAGREACKYVKDNEPPEFGISKKLEELSRLESTSTEAKRLRKGLRILVHPDKNPAVKDPDKYSKNLALCMDDGIHGEESFWGSFKNEYNGDEYGATVPIVMTCLLVVFVGLSALSISEGRRERLSVIGRPFKVLLCCVLWALRLIVLFDNATNKREHDLRRDDRTFDDLLRAVGC